VAELLREKELQVLRRIHAAPLPKKLKALAEFVAELGLKTGSLESRFELQKLLTRIAGRPEQHAVNYAVLRSLQRAVYSPEEEGHYALASRCYCHFTSPIRRYPDLTVHRLLETVLSGTRPREDLDRLAVVGEHCSEREQRAEAAERELTKIKLLAYLSQRIGEEMAAVVTGVESFGLFARSVDLPAEGLIHLSSLADDHYRFDRTTHALAGSRSGNTYRLGDLLRVAVLRVDLDRRELDFRLVRRGKRPQSPTKASPRGKKQAAAKGKSRTPGQKRKARGKNTRRQRRP
jgi:ribonuclease R